MYGALGMEADDSSDDDFVLSDEDAFDGEAEVSGGSEELPHPDYTSAKKNQRTYFPHVLPPRKKHKGELQTASNNGEETSAGSSLTEYTPRKRTSKHIQLMNTMQTDSISNVVPRFPVPVGFITTWKQFQDILEKYQQENNLKFRVRSSVLTTTYNTYVNPTDFILLVPNLFIVGLFYCCSTHDDEPIPTDSSGLRRYTVAPTEFRKALDQKAIATTRCDTVDARLDLLQLSAEQVKMISEFRFETKYVNLFKGMAA
eukprot:jgi/Phyca11/131901/e_gw1.119.32.1